MLHENLYFRRTKPLILLVSCKFGIVGSVFFPHLFYNLFGKIKGGLKLSSTQLLVEHSCSCPFIFCSILILYSVHIM